MVSMSGGPRHRRRPGVLPLPRSRPLRTWWEGREVYPASSRNPTRGVYPWRGALQYIDLCCRHARNGCLAGSPGRARRGGVGRPRPEPAARPAELHDRRPHLVRDRVPDRHRRCGACSLELAADVASGENSSRLPYLLDRALAVPLLQLDRGDRVAQNRRRVAEPECIERGGAHAVVGRQPADHDALHVALPEERVELRGHLLAAQWFAHGETRVPVLAVAALAHAGGVRDRLERWMQLRAPSPRPAMHRPDAAVFGEV